jgi:aspartate/methionine/tyrosine aminotransferase
VLIVPGDHFGMDGYLRIGFGDETGYLREGLNRLHELLVEIDGVRLPPSRAERVSAR